MNSKLRLWLELPQTQLYLRLLREKKQECLDRILTMGTLDTTKLPELAELKGSINMLDIMLNLDNLENFFDGEMVNEEDIQTTTRQNHR